MHTAIGKGGSRRSARCVPWLGDGEGVKKTRLRAPARLACLPICLSVLPLLLRRRELYARERALSVFRRVVRDSAMAHDERPSYNFSSVYLRSSTPTPRGIIKALTRPRASPLTPSKPRESVTKGRLHFDLKSSHKPLKVAIGC